MKKFLLIIAFFLVPFLAAAETPLWILADGESYQGEMDTPKEVKERAKRDAESKAVEKAVGTFIKSHTLVSNSQVAEDLIYASVRGKITRAEIVTSDWDARDRNLYRVKIKALIEPVYPEKGESLSARIYLSRTDLKEGDDVRIMYEVNSDCYVYIFSVAADGSVTLLHPNSNMPDNFTREGRAYQFPPPETPMHLKARFLPDYRESSAEERIKIIATRQKEELLSLGFREGCFKVYNAESTGMISDLVKRLNQIEPSDWTEATSVYILRRKFGN